MVTRRRFLHNLAASGEAATLPNCLPRQLQPVAWADTQLRGEHVPVAPDIEPTVRLLEDTPRDRVSRNSVRESNAANLATHRL